MKRVARAILIVLVGMVALAAFAALPLSALAQCAMCKTSVVGSASAETQARVLNSAILVLMIPPVTMFCTIFALAFRYRKTRVDEAIEIKR